MIAKSSGFNYNRILYTGFIVFSVLQMILYKDPLEGLPMLGIALAFDPFDKEVKFTHRPPIQQAWLFLHVGIFFILFGYELITKVFM